MMLPLSTNLAAFYPHTSNNITSAVPGLQELMCFEFTCQVVAVIDGVPQR